VRLLGRSQREAAPTVLDVEGVGHRAERAVRRKLDQILLELHGVNGFSNFEVEMLRDDAVIQPGAVFQAELLQWEGCRVGQMVALLERLPALRVRAEGAKKVHLFAR